MSVRAITVTEKDGRYQIQNTGLSEFEVIGILECVLFDLKTVSRGEKASIVEVPLAEESVSHIGEIQNNEVSQAAVDPPAKEINQEQTQPDIRTRIGNAIKAIRSLGGEVSEIDLSTATDEELQRELEELKNQYKRLKGSKKPNKSL